RRHVSGERLYVCGAARRHGRARRRADVPARARARPDCRTLFNAERKFILNQPHIRTMKTMMSFLLTPNFSWVMSVSRTLKPFQRFSAVAPKTVKTVSSIRCFADTWLKPGVNENCAACVAATFQSPALL